MSPLLLPLATAFLFLSAPFLFHKTKSMSKRWMKCIFWTTFCGVWVFGRASAALLFTHMFLEGKCVCCSGKPNLYNEHHLTVLLFIAALPPTTPVAVTMINEDVCFVFFFNFSPPCLKPFCCRYTFFFVLYPMGVAGELLTIYAALPYVQKTGLYSVTLPNKYNFSFDYYSFLILTMISYIPSKST